MVYPIRPNAKQNTVTNRGDAGEVEELNSQILELKVAVEGLQKEKKGFLFWQIQEYRRDV